MSLEGRNLAELFPNLRSFAAYSYNIHHLDHTSVLSQIMNNLESLPHFTSLKLDGKIDTRWLEQILTPLTKLTSLELDNMIYSDQNESQYLKDLQRICTSLPNLSSLSLYHYVNDGSRWRPESIRTLGEILGSLPKLTSLTLNMGLEGAPNGPEKMKLFRDILTPIKTLTHLSLNGSEIGRGPNGPEQLEILGEILVSLPQLTSLGLRGNGIGNRSNSSENMRKLREILSPLTTLTTLDLSGNDIGDGQIGLEKMGYLRETLSHLTKLKNLALGIFLVVNDTYSQKLEILGGILAPLTELTTLNLSDCHTLKLSLNPEEIDLIRTLFVPLTNLRSLDLGWRYQTDESPSRLLEMFSRRYPSLKVNAETLAM